MNFGLFGGWVLALGLFLTVVGAVIEARKLRHAWAGARTAKAYDEVEGVRQKEGTVVVHIVAQPVVCHWCLWRNGFQGRMRINQ